MLSTKREREAKGKTLALGFFLLASLMAAWLLLAAKPAHAATFTVNSTGDAPDANLANGACDVNASQRGNQCSLRAAIQEANAAPGPHTINFNIPSGIANKCNPSTNVCTISPTPVQPTDRSALPEITRAVTINGYSQPGASVNTATTGTNAVLKIVLDGSKVPSGPSGPSASGLLVSARNTTVRGLVINNGFRSGVIFAGETPSNAGRTLEGCFIGTAVSGEALPPAGKKLLSGVLINNGEGNVIGGDTLAARNLLSANRDNGVFISGGANGNRVEGNLIGTKRDGTTALGNLTGVYVLGGSDNTIGGTGAASNTIAFHTLHGVQVQSAATGNRILFNSIHSNSRGQTNGLGIQLEADSGVTPNDPDDPDTGANTLQNFPGISSAVTASGGPTTITGGLNSTPNQTFTIQFFSSPTANPSGFGEGKTFIGQINNLTTNANGNASFTFTANQVVPLGWRVTATATGVGGTSEFSRARIVTRPP